MGAKMSRRVHPKCKQHKWGSDDYWRCYGPANALTVYHPSSTCMMGRKDDPRAVVDPRLK